MKRIFLKTNYGTGFLIAPEDVHMIAGIMSRAEPASIDYENIKATVTASDHSVGILFIEEANITRPSNNVAPAEAVPAAPVRAYAPPMAVSATEEPLF